MFILSCNKDEEPDQSFSEAAYRIEITGNWKTPEFGVPAGVHFTSFIGMVHNEMGMLWMQGQLASMGVENVAEIGSNTSIYNEINTTIDNRQASALVLIPAPAPTGMSTRTVYCNTNYFHISFVSMIAPSPDWFVGVSGLKLYRNNQWLADTTIQLYVHDAGTETGDVFSYDNPAMVPAVPIAPLTPAAGSVLANGNPTLQPIARARFTRL